MAFRQGPAIDLNALQLSGKRVGLLPIRVHDDRAIVLARSTAESGAEKSIDVHDLERVVVHGSFSLQR